MKQKYWEIFVVDGDKKQKRGFFTNEAKAAEFVEKVEDELKEMKKPGKVEKVQGVRDI